MPDDGLPPQIREAIEAYEAAALERFRGTIEAAVDRQMAERLAEVEAAVRANERQRIRPLVAQWRTAAGHLASTNAAWSSHFYDCANELERLIGTEGATG